MRYDDDSLTGLESHQRGRKPGGAIYHMKVRTGSRGGGQSARACAAYIEREAEYSRDPESAAELVYTESGHMPDWADAEAGAIAYWDAADLYERSNGRLYKSIEIALPLALDPDQQRELAVQFAHHLTDAEQLPYTLAIHAGKGENPHCHLMISERTNDDIERSPEQWFKRYNAAEPEDGGAQKSTALKPKEWLLETRAAWAEQTNAALKEAGHEIQIDHRSLEAQGIERLPGIHLGPAAAAMEARGELSERGNIQAETNRLNEQLRAVEEEIKYERQRQSEREPRAAQAETEQRPRAGVAAEPAAGTAALRAADRDRGAADRDRGTAGREWGAAGRAGRGTDRVADLTPPDDRLAGSDQHAPRGALPDGGAAGRGAGAERGRGVETEQRHRDPLDDRGAGAGPGLGGGAQPTLEPPTGARTRAGVVAEPGAVEGAGVGGVGERGRGADIPPGWPPAHGQHGVDGSAEKSLGLSPAVGHGDDGRAAENPGASRQEDSREVNAAAGAQAQIAAAEAAIVRAAAQAGALLAEAERRIGRAEEQQREQQRDLEQQRRPKAAQEDQGRGYGD